MFTPWSHAVALIYQQLTKTESLNGVCDAARLHASQWQELRGEVPPRRNTFSNANQHRDPMMMMETLYWKMLDYLGGLSPEFVSIRNPSVLARFKKRHIHLLDSSTIQLVLIQKGLPLLCPVTLAREEAEYWSGKLAVKALRFPNGKNG